jgi:hypothetical protein
MERIFLPMAAVGVVMIGLLLRAEMFGEDDLLRINLDNDDMVIAIMNHTVVYYEPLISITTTVRGFNQSSNCRVDFAFIH